MPKDFQARIQAATDMTEMPPHQVMVCSHKPDGTFISASDATADIYGYGPSELIGQQPYQFFHPDDLKTISETHHRAALLTGITESIIYRVRQKDGSYRVLETITHTRRDSMGMPVELITHTIAVN